MLDLDYDDDFVAKLAFRCFFYLFFGIFIILMLGAVRGWQISQLKCYSNYPRGLVII